FVRGAEQIVTAAAILEPEHPVAVFRPAVRRLVRRTRQQRGEQNLLSANGVHLVADDALDLAQHPQTQRQPRVQTRSDRPDVACADQQLVTGHLGVGGVVSQRAQEQLGHAGDHSRQPYSCHERELRRALARSVKPAYSSPASTASRVCCAAAISPAEKPIQNALMPTSTAIAAIQSSEEV